jgi:cyclopropane fatty-acyl-phospholipid synthase-like methyltransferase
VLLDSVRHLLGLHTAPVPALPTCPEKPAPSLVPDASLAEDDDPVWPSARLSVAEALWGEGFLFPGGRTETLRLAKPLGLSEASSLLLIGAGAGGPSRSIASEFGGWVTGYEANTHLADVANDRNQRAGLGRRAQVEVWDPLAPKFPRHYFHHCIALEPLHGAPFGPVLAAAAAALQLGGQLVLVESVADRPLLPTDPAVAAWVRLEHRGADVPSELAITTALGKLGFDVRIAEDVSRRHLRYAIDGWLDAVQAMQGKRPTTRQLAVIVREAEAWLARFRLMRAGQLRLVRWHAIGSLTRAG